jgi:hypothetical protein
MLKIILLTPYRCAKKSYIKLPPEYVDKVYMKHKWVLWSDLAYTPISLIMYMQIFQNLKSSKSDPILVPSTSDEGHLALYEQSCQEPSMHCDPPVSPFLHLLPS